MQVSQEAFRQRHLAGWETDEFVCNTLKSIGAAPHYSRWKEVSVLLPSAGAILEIGPGSGHLLAAARESGRQVVGVETSEMHRDFIARTWGIRTVVASMDQIPRDVKFAGVIVMNTIEHVFDVVDFLSKLSEYMSRDSILFISTCNAGSIPPAICGAWWAMFKPLDHVSLPTRQGLLAVANRSGFKVGRVWSHELPFETAISVAGAARDWLRSRNHDPNEGRSVADTGGGDPTRLRSLVVEGSKRLCRIDPVTPVLSALGVGSSIKALFQPKSDAISEIR